MNTDTELIAQHTKLKELIKQNPQDEILKERVKVKIWRTREQ